MLYPFYHWDIFLLENTLLNIFNYKVSLSFFDSLPFFTSEFFLCTTIFVLTIHCSLLIKVKDLGHPILTQSLVVLGILTMGYSLLIVLRAPLDPFVLADTIFVGKTVSSLGIHLSLNNLELEFIRLKFLVYDNLFSMDSFILFSKSFIILLTFCYLVLLLLFSPKIYINNFEYIILILSASFSLCLLIGANDFLSFYLTLEMQSLCLYVLAASKKTSTFSTEAGLKYFVLGAFSSCLLLLGISLFYGVFGTTNFDFLTLLLETKFVGLEQTIYIICLASVLLIFVSFFFKLAAAPFHIWVADVYEGAPLSSTVFFVLLPKFSLFIIILRIYFGVFNSFQGDIFNAVGLVGFISVFVGSFVALKQKKLKRLLTFSSISHVGYLLLALSSSTFQGVEALLFYLILYSLTNLSLWTILIVMSFPQTTQKSRTIVDFSVLTRNNLILGCCSLAFIFSLAGLPPFAGFYAKFLVFSATINSSFLVLSGVVLLISLVSAYYYIRLIKNIFFEVIYSNKLFLSIYSLPLSFFISFNGVLLPFIFFNNIFLLEFVSFLSLNLF